MHAFAGQRIQIRGQRSDQGLAFAGAHLGDLAAMQHHAADQLYVEVTHAERAPARLPYRGESFRHQFVKLRTPIQAISELGCLLPQSTVAERLEVLLEFIDALDVLLIALDQALVATAKNLSEYCGNHAENLD
jgi:hypothetical protein